jgi:hypothetical protein
MKQTDIENIAFSIEKRFQTTMIGSLARVEDHLGFIWGHNQDMISIEQSDNRQIWQDLREDILDHCNYQMRGALSDLRKFIQQENKSKIAFTENYTFKCQNKKELTGEKS